MEHAEAARAATAAIAVARSLGLPADDAAVLGNANRLTLRLSPCDALARVAPVGPDTARFEVGLAQRLTEAGCPTGRLDPRVPPLVYSRDGFDVTLWTYYEPAAPQVSPAAYAGALARLHAGMREVNVRSPRFTDRIAAAAEIAARPDRSPELAGADRAFLSGQLVGLRQAIEGRHPAEQLLHGEPHPGNVLSTRDGPLFIDLETCCRGPVEFDLAHVPESACARYPGLDRPLLDECRQLVLALVAAWRWRRDDHFPHGRRYGGELLRALRAGPPWPTLDTITRRLGLSLRPDLYREKGCLPGLLSVISHQKSVHLPWPGAARATCPAR